MPDNGPGRTTQSEIYRAGLPGLRPTVPTNFAALESAAQKRLSPEAFGYLVGGAGTEATMAANRQALQRILPRVLVGAAERDLSISLFGHRLPSPFVPSPFVLCLIGVAEVAHRDADLAVGRAAADLEVPLRALHPSIPADGGGRRRDGNLPPLVPAVLVVRERAQRLIHPPGRSVRRGGHRRHPRYPSARPAQPRP